MKVFTVGLDQKPPIKDASDPASEKASGGSPPPGYVPTQNVKHVPLPMGPEIPQPPHPIVVRKSRGYKGILMVMLSVFLMALFALTLSEIAYNRQRDENFFRLRWAELKHRLGYGDNAYDYYHRASAVLNADRYFSLSKNKEMAEALIQQSDPTSTTSPPPSSTPEPVVAIDSFPPKPSSFEQQQQQPEGMLRDARLQFLKTILQKIKQHAEDMGFDGTMQVSVIEVEPQTDEQFSPFGGQHQNQHQMSKGQSFHPLLPNFFPHLPIEDQQAPKSDSFMDGFGEYHQPTFMQNNQVAEQNRARANVPFGAGWPREEDNQQQQHQPHNAEFGDVGSIQWPRANSNPFRPDSFFHPMNNWQMIAQQQQQAFPQPPHILPRPPSFDRWSGAGAQNMGEGEDNSQQHPQPHQPMIQVFPQQPAMPMLPPMVGPNANQQQQQPEQQQQQQFEQNGAKSNEHFSPDTSSSSNASPSQEVVGEIYGRKFGRMLQDIIANRIQGFQNMQQLNPLMLPPSAVLGSQQPDQRSRVPFPEGGQPPPPPPFFPPPPGPQQQMPMPQQWWQQQANAPAQHQIPAAHLMEEGQGKLGEKSLPPPPPVIFFPMGQGQALNGQPQPFPAFAKEMMGQRKEQFGQPFQFPVFKNFVPPEDRIQVEPPQQNFPSQPEGGNGPQQAPRGSNSDEPLVKTLVDNNMNGPRGWTHQFPKSSSQQQEQPGPDNSDSSNSQENVTPAQSTGSPEQQQPAAPQDSKSSNEQQAPASKDGDGDVWLVAPPHRTQPPPPPPPMVDASTDDSSAATPVDFPAVKFPMMSPNNEAAKPAGNSQTGDALSSPQNDQQGQQAVHSNPVFFQVDDPSSVEQPRVVA